MIREQGYCDGHVGAWQFLGRMAVCEHLLWSLVYIVWKFDVYNVVFYFVEIGQG